MAKVSCVAPCACVGLSINATNPKPYTGTAFTAAMWVELARSSESSSLEYAAFEKPPQKVREHNEHMKRGGSRRMEGFECVLSVEVIEYQSGRMLLQAATLSAPLPGNHSVALKDSLEMAAYMREADPLPF